MKILDDSIVKLNLKPRKLDSHKGDFGRLLCVNGSVGMTGACILSARAALKCGVSLVDIAVPEKIYNVVACNLFEPIFTILEKNSLGVTSDESMQELIKRLNLSTTCLVGCGLSVTEDTNKIFNSIIDNVKVPLVIDADGINILSSNINMLKKINKGNVIITPHPGEMARLLRTTVKDIQGNRKLYACNFAKVHNITVVLKGANTIISSPDGDIYVNKTGNPGMAKGGSGDVLAGMIAAFAAQGISLKHAAAMGVYIHGLAGDLSAKKFSQISMTPSDIIESIGETLKSILH